MADVVVSLIALILGLMFFAVSLGLFKGLDQLASVQRMRRRWGGLGVRIFHFLLGALLVTVSAAIYFNWW